MVGSFARPTAQVRSGLWRPPAGLTYDQCHLLRQWHYWIKADKTRAARWMTVPDLVTELGGRRAAPEVEFLLKALRQQGLVSRHSLLGWRLTASGLKLGSRTG